MQNGDEALPSIILVGQGPLVKMFIILEPHHRWSINIHKQCYHTKMFVTSQRLYNSQDPLRHASANGEMQDGVARWPPFLEQWVNVEYWCSSSVSCRYLFKIAVCFYNYKGINRERAQ